jgi:Domain found in Dishevelled, Egl-10, and Pleckstrin (DEP)
LESFVGKEAVDCLLSLGHASSRDSAVNLGRALMRAGIFRPVNLDQPFTDDNSLYQFNKSLITGDNAHGSLLSEDGESLQPGGNKAALSTLTKQECSLEQPRQDTSRISQLRDDGGHSGVTNRSLGGISTTSETRDDVDKNIQVEAGKELPSSDQGKLDAGVCRGRNAGSKDFSVELPSTEGTDMSIHLDGAKAFFEDMLVAVSGPPMFEASLREILATLGVPVEQILRFAASSQ